jgi:hypothetical protein
MRGVLLLLSFAFVGLAGFTQDKSDERGLQKILNFPDRLSAKLQTQQQRMQGKLERQSEKYLSKLQRQENKLRKQLKQKDSALVAELQLGSDSLFNSWKGTLARDSGQMARLPNTYSGKLDSMKTAIQFLGKQPILSKLSGNQYRYLTERYEGIGNQINQASYLKKLVEDRKALLREKLSSLGLTKQLGKYSKQVHYYQQQLQEYKQILEQPDLIEKKALELLSEVPAFRQYFYKFSALSAMFRSPGQVEDMDPATLLNGLQSRSSIMADLTNRFGSVPNTQQAVTAGLADGQAQLTGIKDKLMNAVNKGETLDMPGFVPNQEKTKTFLKRLVPGFNLQSSRSNRFLPLSTDIGFSLGYKVNNKSIIGASFLYKIGWGNDIKHVAITHEGVGLRTFIDYKLNKSFWLTGGAEWNYYARFQTLAVFKTVNSWQQSALIGLQKKRAFGKYKATVSVLYDGLWNKHLVHTQPIKFRIAYTK